MPGLAERLRRRIEAEGPISFAAYMEAALYDAEDGFYSRGRALGANGSFSTAPTTVPAFADAVAAEIRGQTSAVPPGSDLGDLVLVEAGPGDGSLARALLDRLGDVVSRLVLIERAAGMRHLQEQALADAPVPVEWAETPAEVRVAHGFLVANELLDDQPAHLLEPPDEILVGLDGAGRFREVRAPAPPELLARLPVTARPDGRVAVSPAAEELYRALLRVVSRGRVLVVDYAAPAAGSDPVRTYVGGRRGGDPLQAPGSQNITVDVDFEALRRVAREEGARELAFEAQASWLRRHGATVPPTPRRSDADWTRAALLADRSFRVLLVERG